MLCFYFQNRFDISISNFMFGFQFKSGRKIYSPPKGYPRLSVKILNKVCEFALTSQFERIICARDIRCLQFPCGPFSDPCMELLLYCLNDLIVNQYMDVLVHHCRTNQKYGTVHTMASHFWTMLNGWGHGRAKRVAGNADIFTSDVVLVPIHHRTDDDDYWCLAVIYPKRREIKYYDSRRSCSDSETVLTKLSDYIISECSKRDGVKMDRAPWKKQTVKDIPLQKYWYDSGVFVCAYAGSIARNRPKFNFTQNHMPYFRKKIAYEICSGQILHST